MLRRALLIAPLAVLGFASVADAKSSGGTGYPPRRGSGSGVGFLILLGGAILWAIVKKFDNGLGKLPQKRKRSRGKMSAKHRSTPEISAPIAPGNKRISPYFGPHPPGNERQ